MNNPQDLNDILESVLLLFLKTLYDFNPYIRNPDEQERLIDMPLTLKKVLREIISSDIFVQLILVNETNKAEEKAREKALRKEQRKRQLIEGIKSIKIQDENYENNLKLIKNKRSLNTSCFNQRSISTLNQYYNSVNEMMCIKNTVLLKIKKIELDSIMSCLELEKNNKIIHNTFIFINPNKKESFLSALSSQNKPKRKLTNESKFKSSVYSSSNVGNEMMLSRGFMSLDNYYKFIKKKLNKISEEQNDIKEIKHKKRIKLDSEEKKNKKESKIKVYNTEIREILPEIKKYSSANKNRMNFVLLNKDVKYQFKRTNFMNNTKRLVSKENQQYLPYKDFDYKNILSLFK